MRRFFLLVLALLACSACVPHQGSNPDPTLRIYLARHGRTAWNAERRLQGRSDIPLDDVGREQARQLAVTFDGVRLDAIYCSSRVRSKQTASALEPRAPITSLAELDEQGIGKFEGLYFDGRDPGLEAEYARRSQDLDDSFDGGESAHQHLERVARAIEKIRAEHESGTILIVGHGGTNAMIVAVLFDLSLDEAKTFRQANDEVYAIDLRPGRRPLLFKLVPR